MRFNQEVVYTGKEERTSKKGNNYTVVNLLDATGKQFSCMLTQEAFIPAYLKQLDKVLVEFELEVGRYTSLKVAEIDLVPMD